MVVLLCWLWDGIGWVIFEVGLVFFVLLVWFMIVGVVFG